MPALAIICMPFASSKRPSIQAGLIAGLAQRAGWDVDCHHLNLDFAKLLGKERYEVLCDHRGALVSEWLFSKMAFPDSAELATAIRTIMDCDELRTLSTALGLSVEDCVKWIHRTQQVLVPAFVEAALHSTDWGQYQVVAFTCTFQQNMASFALCRLIKEKFADSVYSLFGGANFDGGMGIEFLKKLHFIDFVAVGEADRSFPQLLRQIEACDPDPIPGVGRRLSNGDIEFIPDTVPFDDMDSLPTPDYSDFFNRSERLGLLDETPRSSVAIPFESARGCWWGQKHHCIFCGLNAQTMRYRKKSPDRIIAELRELSGTHKSLTFEAVDNILDMEYLKSLLPSLNAVPEDWTFFYEIKSNLSPDDIAILADAGIRRVQPGIESLSSPLLKQMRKGVTAIQNVALLRNCRVNKIRPSWNLLWGFPGETQDHYVNQIRTISKIPHLQPPDGYGRLWLERFSPMFSTPEQFGISNVTPLPSYSEVYPGSIDLTEVSYFFDYAIQHALPDTTFEDLIHALQEWNDWWRDEEIPHLTYRLGTDFIEVVEGRPNKARGAYVLTGLLGEVYQKCLKRPISIRVVAEQCDENEQRIAEVVAALEERDLVLCEGHSVLGLAVPA